ncbi:MAG: FecR domain-containing protein [Rhodospirillales bacterium]
MLRVFLFLTIFGLGIAPSLAQAQAKIGQTQTVLRVVSGNFAQTERQLAVADAVYAEETIETGSGAATDLVFEDETTIKIGPGAQVLLDRFVYNPNQGVGDVGVSILKGTLRFVSGSMQSSSYQIQTPAAVVTVRGTVFTLIVDDNGTTTVAVEDGGVTLSTPDGSSVDVGPGQASSASVGSAPGAPTTPPVSVAVATAKMDVLSAIAGGVSSPVALAKAASIGAQSRPAVHTTLTPGATCGG